MRVGVGVVIVVFSLFLIIFACVVFLRQALAERFLNGFASSARTHYAEQILRLLVGAALVVLSPSMWQPNLFRVVGWVIVISSTALMCAPWRWHHRFAQRVRPTFMRYLKFYAVASLAFGTLLLYAVFAGGAPRRL